MVIENSDRYLFTTSKFQEESVDILMTESREKIQPKQFDSLKACLDQFYSNFYRKFEYEFVD